MAEPVSITFLGGLGDIGRNCAAIETGDELLLLDCGQLFPDDSMPGAHSVLPDLSYLDDKGDKIVGCITTHGHEDHIGALAHALRKFPFPIYGSAFTMGMVRSRLDEAGVLNQTTLNPVADHDVFLDPAVAPDLRVSTDRHASEHLGERLDPRLRPDALGLADRLRMNHGAGHQISLLKSVRAITTACGRRLVFSKARHT